MTIKIIKILELPESSDSLTADYKGMEC